MKSKTLLALAVASTFGWSAVAFGGNGHEVVTPFSPNESGEVTFVKKEGFSSSSATSNMGSTNSSASGEVAFSTGFDTSTSASEWSVSGKDDSLSLADDGVYTEYWLVSFAPEATGSWDPYVVIQPRWHELVSIEPVYYLMPSYDIVLIQDTSDDIPSDLG